MVRREIRCLTNFSRNPNVCTDFVGITDGTPLDEDLGSIKFNAEQNYESFKKHFFDTGKYDAPVARPVFITKMEKEESNRIEKKYKADIVTEISTLLDELPNDAGAEVLRDKFAKNCKRFKHAELVDFFYEVKAAGDEYHATVEVEEVQEQDEIDIP